MSFYIRKVISFTYLSLMIPLISSAQSPDSLKTGYLADAAEEYWPLQNIPTTDQIKHIPIRSHKGYVSNGLSLRESYEFFDGYLWGIGPQDHNGYFLQRALLHSDVRWSRHLRVFGEMQSSIIAGRNGGPRPVQDQNKLSVLQLFGELSLKVENLSFKFRLGKQSLNYGQGTLLDLRDANVRRSFAGVKLMIERKQLRIDAFIMEPMTGKEGFFDDIPDRSQTVAGAWATHMFGRGLLNRLDFYYLWIKRRQNKFNEGIGNESRSTIGTAFTLRKGNWYSYNELDFQFGSFGEGNILAWKIAPSIGYQMKDMPCAPVISIQGAISSGDAKAKDGDLQTFSPLFPKAIYYGFIDNAGSSNLIVFHPKAELQISSAVKVTMGYYRFWRQRISDGIYAVNGAYLLPATGTGKYVGTMLDIAAICNVNDHLSLQLTGSYYKRGTYLAYQKLTGQNIVFTGFKVSFRI